MGTCGKMTSVSLLSSILQLKMINSAVAANSNIGNDYKALVCVFLKGGNDSFNMLTPSTQVNYDQYVEARAHLALDKAQQHAIPTNNSNNMNHLGVHYAMPEIQSAYRGGDLAFIANVGTLVRPTTLADYNNKVELPRGLFSHREQQLSWQTSVPDSLSARGWIGRMTEMINEDESEEVTMNISIGANNMLQRGPSSNPFIISREGAKNMAMYEKDDVKAVVDATLAHQYENVIKQHYNYRLTEIIEKNKFYNDAIANNNDPFAADAFPNTNLGNELRQVALAIHGREVLGVKRQTFYVGFGSFDHHGNLLFSQEELLPQLSQALDAFNNAMKQLGLHDQVITYTASDFARTITSNSTGTDHAWGGNQMIMGGAVNGKKVHGLYPDDLREGAMDIDTGRGRFIPTTSVDELHAELASWYGVSSSGLGEVFPNLSNFNYSKRPQDTFSSLGLLDLPTE